MPGQSVIIYLFVCGIDVAFFYDFTIKFWMLCRQCQLSCFSFDRPLVYFPGICPVDKQFCDKSCISFLTNTISIYSQSCIKRSSCLIWPLKRGSNSYEFSISGLAKCDLLIQMTSWAGLTVDWSLWDKVCRLLVAGQWFSLGTRISSSPPLFSQKKEKEKKRIKTTDTI